MFQQVAKTFFSPRGVLIFGCALFYVCFAGINSLYFLDRLSYHDSEHQKTLTYFQQTVCQDSRIKAQTEGKNKCDEYAVFLSTKPWRRALLDVFESNFACSGGACSRWFNHLLLIFVLASILLGYVFIRHTAWTVEKANELQNSLPYIFGTQIPKAKKYQ